MRRPAPADMRWPLWLLVVLAAAVLFLLLHPYRGLVHDSRLYTLQALSHLHPQLYEGDIFLKLGSQDNYTIFSPLYAVAISWLGVEPAAMLMTLAGMLAFLAAGYLLARSVGMSYGQAGVALLLLLLVPAHYGPSRIFHYLEEFVSPRQFAGALVLLSLLAWAHRRMLPAALVTAGALMVHPIIGLSGLALLVTAEVIVPHWRSLLGPLSLLGAGVAALILAGVIPLSRWQFDPEWQSIAMSRLYLDLRNWNADDWGRIATVFTTLIIAAATLAGQANRLAVAAVVACASLTALALVGGNLMGITLVVQAQVWRALWLATALAVILLPAMYASGWPSKLRRSGLVFLTGAWIAPHPSFALSLSSLALASAILAPREAAIARHVRILGPAAWCALVVAILASLGDAHLALVSDLTRSASLPPLLDRIATSCMDGVIPAAVLMAGGYLALRYRSLRVSMTLVASAASILLLIAAPTTRTWANVNVYGQAHEAYAEWRALIPPGSEVFWNGESSEREAGAFYTWLLLERPSYMSRIQASNALFSRASALEMRRRAATVAGVLSFDDPFRAQGAPPPRGPTLAAVCQNTGIRYLVTNERMPDAAPVPPPPSIGPPLRDYKLYICP